MIMAGPLVNIIQVKVLEGYTLYLEFEDGRNGEVDISQLISFTGIYEVLRNHTYFSNVKINPKTQSLCWENGVTISSAYLREHIVRG